MNEEEFFNKYVMRNPFDFKKSIIAHCRTLDKYDVYQWVADDEEKIKNLLEENNQLKKDIKNIIRILNKNCDDLEATEEEFESLEKWTK